MMAIQNSISILVLEDKEADFLLVCRALSQAGIIAECTRVDSVAALQQALQTPSWQAVLSDFSVPGLDIRQALALVRESLPDTPVILVSGSVGEEQAVDLLKSGMWDFVLKDNLARLPHVLERSLREAADRHARKEAEAALRMQREQLEELVARRTRELAEAEAQSRLILDSSADGIYGMDPEGRVIFVNPAACAMLGYPPEKLLGQPLHELIHYKREDGSPYPARECPLLATVRQGIPARVDWEVYWHADGHAIPVSYASHPMVRDGKVLGAVVSFSDITLRRAVEAAREESRQSAERLARIKGEFLANMSHEIRTPLNAILGFAQVGQKEDYGRRSVDLFARILDSGQLLMGVINDILDFSKIEAGKLSLEDGTVDLGQVVDRVASVAGERAGAKGVAFRVEEAADLPATCRGDPLRLSQVLLNLLSNAVKFTLLGEVALSVRREGEVLLMTVKDSGIGMSAEEVGRLFRAFVQGDSSTTRRFGGTGLGLAISRRLVDLMGGEIRVQSVPGEGSLFELRLPLREPSGLASGRARGVPAHRAAQPHEKRLAGISILAAEDNETNRIVLADILALEGAHLVCVENGRLAVERLEQEGAGAFNIVLTDIQMPEMDGHEAARRICAVAPDLPVVGLTAHALAEEKARCLASGMVAHVAKPIDTDNLVAVILKYSRPGRVPASASPPANFAVSLAHEGPGDSACPIDWASLRARYQNRVNFIARLLGAVLESTADMPAQLRQAAAAGDMARMAFLAHSLKGMSANLAAERFRQDAGAAEVSARVAGPETPERIRRLADDLEILMAELTRYGATLF